MRIKFIVESIPYVIDEVTSVHYLKKEDEYDTIISGLSVLQSTSIEPIVFTDISEKDCNIIVNELFEKGYVSLENYDYDNILALTDA